MSIRSNNELAELLVLLAEESGADLIACATEEGELVEQLLRRAVPTPLLAATTNEETYRRLAAGDVEALLLPFRTAERYRQVDHMLSVALREGAVSPDSLVVCATGCNLYREASPLLLVTEVDPEVRDLRVSDLLELTDAIQASVLEATIEVACAIGRAARRGKRVGTIFTLGDSESVLEGARQLVPNPFAGHGRESRVLTNRASHEALLELAKLDGAFVARGDGFIRAAGVYLASPNAEDAGIGVSPGLGARHVAAAAVTARTTATAVVVSATDGDVRVFSGGELALRVDPEAAERIPPLRRETEG